jgi:hypothetical protein
MRIETEQPALNDYYTGYAWTVHVTINVQSTTKLHYFPVTMSK